ncbi:MAG: RraA family protein, partial [Variibacter sp.]|nr:RraA family protein [Variibacter sp.]
MTLPWSGDDELFAIARRELFTAVVGDVMDKLKLRRQFLPPAIQPLRRDMVAVGRAMTVLEADFFEDVAPGANPIS